MKAGDTIITRVLEIQDENRQSALKPKAQDSKLEEEKKDLTVAETEKKPEDNAGSVEATKDAAKKEGVSIHKGERPQIKISEPVKTEPTLQNLEASEAREVLEVTATPVPAKDEKKSENEAASKPREALGVTATPEPTKAERPQDTPVNPVLPQKEVIKELPAK